MCDLTCQTTAPLWEKSTASLQIRVKSNFSSDSYVPLCFPEGCYLNELGVQQIWYETGIHITIQILHSNNN